MRFLVSVLSVLLVTASCAAPASERDPLAGSYRIGGGDAALANVEALTAAFTAKHPGVKFQIDTTLGSDAAVNLAADGTFDLGMTSRELTSSENSLVDHVLVGVAGTGLVVNQKNTVVDLSRAQIEAIYSGKITDWSSVGGPSTPIIPLMREKGSSARLTFESFVFGGKPTYGQGVLEINGGDQMRQAVAGLLGTVGMVGVSTDDPEAAGIRLVSIDGVASTRKALRDGTYHLRRPLNLVFTRNGELKPAIERFLDFIRGAEGQAILERF